MKYKVIRTNADNCNELQELFNDGWQYKCCHQSEYRRWNSNRFNYELFNCLEYILYKKD